MDISRDRVSSIGMLYLAFTAAGFSCCLFVALSAFLVLSSAGEMLLNRVEIRRLTWPLRNTPPFYFQKLLGCFCWMFWLIVHLYYEAPSNQLCCICLNLVREYIPIHFRIYPAINTSNPVPLEAMHAHAITLLHRVSQMMLCALDHELFQAFSIPFSSRHSGTGWS